MEIEREREKQEKKERKRENPAAIIKQFDHYNIQETSYINLKLESEKEIFKRLLLSDLET